MFNFFFILLFFLEMQFQSFLSPLIQARTFSIRNAACFFLVEVHLQLLLVNIFFTIEISTNNATLQHYFPMVALMIKSMCGYCCLIQSFPLASYCPWSTPLLDPGVGLK